MSEKKKLYQFENYNERREYIEKEKGINLENIGKAYVDEGSKVFCENMIGALTLPLGVAGPVKIHGTKIEGDFYIPLATTEGALVASVARGCSSITKSGGATVTIDRSGANRGSVYFTENARKAKDFEKWIRENESKLAELVESKERFIKYLKAEIRIVAQYTFVRFNYNTNDAMGMNMVTIANTQIANYIEKETGIKCLAVAGNYDIDKKPSWLNFINHRGYQVWAETVLTKEVLENTLKTNAHAVFETWLSKVMVGSAMAGSLGYNCHFANIVAAFYAATGQDLAHTVDGSHGMTFVKPNENGDLYVSIFMPAVMLGTVGGGNSLNTQKEARSLIGIEDKGENLAEVLGTAVLAGEISLLGALSEGTLAKAHADLGR
jgi:hydroxymethylglutaryl-CoA reductase (NADPH)